MTDTISRSRQSVVEVRRFYLGLGILLAVLATIGFWPQYFRPLITGGLETDGVIHVHAAVFIGWLLLFIFQCFLVATGNIGLHRRIGNFGLLYGCLVIVVGLTTAIVRFASGLEQGGIEAVENSAIFPLTDMVLFSGFFGAAAFYRKKPELHKRLMIVTASSILIPSTARFASAIGLEGVVWHAVSLTLWLSPVLVAMAYDYVRYRMIHAVYILGALIIAISSFRGPLGYTNIWVSFTHWLASVVS